METLKYILIGWWIGESEWDIRTLLLLQLRRFNNFFCRCSWNGAVIRTWSIVEIYGNEKKLPIMPTVDWKIIRGRNFHRINFCVKIIFAG